MWKEYNVDVGHGHCICSYKIDNSLIAEIRHMDEAIGPGAGRPKTNRKFFAWIYTNRKFGSSDPHWIYGDDLDILKLKCLVKANDFGWPIKELNI